MDEKTEELRDIFVDVAGEEEVTESQEEARGSLASEAEIDERLEAVVESMRERYDFATSLSTADLVTVVRGFYDGDSDREIAERLDRDTDVVRRARVDLHLLTDEDRDAPFDLDRLRNGLQDGRDVDAIAADIEASEPAVRRYRHVLRADENRRLVADRYRREFERLLTDGELSERLTDEVKQTGLEEAAEDIETNVSF